MKCCSDGRRAARHVSPSRPKSEPADQRPAQNGVNAGQGRHSSTARGTGALSRGNGRPGSTAHVAGRSAAAADHQSQKQNGRLHRRQVFTFTWILCDCLGLFGIFWDPWRLFEKIWRISKSVELWFEFVAIFGASLKDSQVIFTFLWICVSLAGRMEVMDDSRVEFRPWWWWDMEEK